jgi:predicted nucleic acid-binding protein
LILIDTSAWVEFFRGRGVVADRVDEAIDANTAAICGPVLTELGRGLLARERKTVLSLLAGCTFLEQPPDLWRAAGDLGFLLRSKGVTVKTMDLLIASHALFHQVPLLTVDKDFKAMVKPGIDLHLLVAR